MSPLSLPVRFVIFGLASATAGAPDSWGLGAGLAVFAGLTGLGLAKRLRSRFDDQVAFLATLALLTSVPLTATGGTPDVSRILGFGLSSAAFFWLARDPAPRPFSIVLAALLAVAPTLRAWTGAAWWSLSGDNLLASLWGAQGLLYGAPLLWGGFLGLVKLRREQPGVASLALAGIASGVLAMLFITDHSDDSARSVFWAPFLLPGLARCFVTLRGFAARHPQRIIGMAAGLLILWNLLLMEQYRRLMLPADDTISFARATSNSASLLSRAVGTPFAWPANWIFAVRFGTTLDKWDGVAGRRLFPSPSARTTTIEFGDDPSLFATDAALLLEGFGMRRTCERGWCRDLDGAGRLLLPVGNVGRGEFVVRLRARGEGVVRISLDDLAVSVSELPESLADLTLRVPARLVPPGVKVLSLSVAGGGRATLDRLTLERDP